MSDLLHVLKLAAGCFSFAGIGLAFAHFQRPRHRSGSYRAPGSEQSLARDLEMR